MRFKQYIKQLPNWEWLGLFNKDNRKKIICQLNENYLLPINYKDVINDFKKTQLYVKVLDKHTYCNLWVRIIYNKYTDDFYIHFI